MTPMLSFRQKIFLSYIAVFFLFIALLFPFAKGIVNDIVTRSMVERADELISILQREPDDYALVDSLKNSKHKVFFRVGVYTEERKVLYDSHAKRRLGPEYSLDYKIEHPEVKEAFKKGIGTYEGYSEISGQEMFYLAKSFDFHGKTYILRVSLPYQYVRDFTRNFEMGFLGLAAAVLLLFTIMTWFIINHLTNPIHQIIRAVRPYQEGYKDSIPKIILKSSNPKDEFGRLANTLNSLTEKVQSQINTLTHERNEKQAILESLVEGVISIDNNLTINYVNQAASNLLGIRRKNLINHPFSILDQPKFQELLESCIERQQPLTDDLVQKIDGRKVYYDVVAAPKKEKTGAILVIQDKSSHFGVLEMRKDFIANASHELKTPITIIQGFAETLHDNCDLPKETITLITSKIVKNCKRMTTLIKDLLALADIEHLSDSRLNRSELLPLIENCIQMLYDAHPDVKVMQNFPEEPISVHADSQLLELAFSNLLENAAKYSTPPAEITITIAKKENSIEIKISDKGIGIPQEDMEHIFHRFYTVDKAHSQKMGGSGLGLSLVETIIEKHLGKISVTSEVGVGTTFTITLPNGEK